MQSNRVSPCFLQWKATVNSNAVRRRMSALSDNRIIYGAWSDHQKLWITLSILGSHELRSTYIYYFFIRRSS